jgi:cobalt-zinc-cadmium resistance protein CzcA
MLAIALGLFGTSLWVFSNMGGEFIPTLEEGDFAVETRVITGSSLQNTVAATTQAEKILLEQFPEVKQVVSKIGAGEIPTDPMPVEAADMMVILKNKDEWVTASNREELANKMAEALEVIPGVTFGFQQPIQMRFNELMTGVRQDVAVKIYGEDLNELSEYAEQIGRLASGVEGAEDLYIEEVTGVPQIVINYKRDQLAKYGLSIRDVNRSVQAAFAGASAGLVYENERRFDLVVRLDKTNREDVESVRNLYIARKDGHQIPLYQVAEVEIQEGPYQIQRDDTRRRIIVAFNVRNRDVESIVTELQQKIDESVVFAPGYTVSYGGQFENLVEARERLSFAVPLALLLIFVLLYFTFGSIKQGILIFTAIPLSAIGGIFALWLRDMPFSISAGVGFIALFGVAVLNGIVLISEFNHLKKDGISDIFERIYKGTSVRLRPVIMTAAVASLGFLPMALSQSGGAEVQRPLATVVIGGLITATFLTLVVLPILYYYFERGIKVKPGAVAPLLIIGLFFFQFQEVKAQESPASFQSLDEAIQVAIQNNPTLKAADLQTQQERALKGASWNLSKTNFSLTHGQYSSIYDNDNQFNISQSIEFPTVYANQNKLAKARMEASEWRKNATQNELVQQVKATWYILWFEKSKRQLLLEQDSIYQRFVRAAGLRYQTGESNLLEKATAESQVAEIKAMLQQNQSDIEIYQTQLQTLLNLESPIDITLGNLKARESSVLLDTQGIANNPTLAWFRQQMEVAEREKSVEKSRLLPDLTVGYFNQSLNGPNQDLDGNPVTFTSSDRFTGFQVGIAIPIFGAKSQGSVIKAAELKKQENEARLQAVTNELQGRLRSLIQQYQKFQTSIDYYEQNALPQAELILKQAQKGFENGEIGYVEYIQGLNRALTVRFNYLDILNQYNQTIIQIEFISGVQ